MRALVSLLVCIGFGLAAQALTVRVTSPPRTVEPGDVALHVFRLENPQDSTLGVDLSVELPQGWSVLPIAPQLTLDPEDAATVFVTVQVPPAAGAGEHDILLAARWNSREATATARVTVRQVAQVAIDVPAEKSISPGESVSYTFTVSNRGNAVDRYTVSADSARRYTLRVDPRELSLAPMERGTVTVEADIPLTADAGRDRLLLIVRSTAAPAVEREVALFTTILPPGPELIVGHTLAEVDTQLGGRLEFDLLNDQRQSSLFFSGRTSLLDGVLSFAVRASGPWGAPPLDVDRVSLAYTHDQARVRAGEFTVPLAPLSGLSGSGVAVEFLQGRASLSLASGWHEGEGRFGGTVTVRGNAWELGTVYRETRGEDEHRRALAGRVTHFLGEHVEFELAASLALEPPILEEGLRAALRVEVERVAFLGLSWHSVGGAVPSPLAGEEGVSVSGRLASAPLGFRFACRWVRDNPQQHTTEGNASRVELSSATDWAPEEWPLAFFGSFSGRREWDGEGTALERVREAHLAVSGNAEPLAFHLSGTLRTDEELPNGHIVFRTAYEQRFTLSGEFVQGTLSLRQQAAFDPPGDPLERGWEVGLSARLVDMPYRLTLSWTHDSPDVEAELDLQGPLTDSFSAGLTAAAHWNDQGEVASLRLGLAFEHVFSWTPPFLPARGWLEGSVLADGRGVEGAVLATAGHRVATDAEGRFLFPPLAPGEYSVAIDRLPFGVRALEPEPVEAEVELDKRTHIVIHCELLAEVRGLVFDDRGQQGERHPDDPGLGGITVTLLEKSEPAERTTTNSAGRFSFSHLSPGNYTLRLETDSLPLRYEATTPTQREVKLEQGAVAEVEFGAWQRPREVVVAPAPPLADFAWEPPVPQAGDSVTFDGRLSAPGDSDILAYRWDFTDDGEIDATGREAIWTFSEPGVYWVTLTVEDELGLQDELTLPLEVLPAE